jgi:pyrroloquinoline quinone biosynthesis protein D
VNAEQRVPGLALGVRTRRLDDGKVVLLVPEGVVNLNPSAAATVELFDGVRSCAQIATELAERFDAPRGSIVSDVAELVDRLAARGWVFFSSDTPSSEQRA